MSAAALEAVTSDVQNSSLYRGRLVDGTIRYPQRLLKFDVIPTEPRATLLSRMKSYATRRRKANSTGLLLESPSRPQTSSLNS